MSNQKVEPEKLADAISDIITEYTDDVIHELPTITKTVAKQCVKNLKSAAAGAGFNGTKYKGSFKSKTVKSTSSVTTITIYSTKYQIAHLLEHGHNIVTKSGNVLGRTRAFPHWSIAEKKANKEFEQKIKMIISGEGL